MNQKFFVFSRVEQLSQLFLIKSRYSVRGTVEDNCSTLKILVAIFAGSLLFSINTHAQGLTSADDFSYDGFTEPAEDVLVSAIEIGRLEKIHVKVGDRVEAGQELAVLENSLQLISVEIAKQQALMKGELEAALAEHRLHLGRTEQLRALAHLGTARPDELTRAETDLSISAAKVMVASEEQLSRQWELKRQEVQLERRRIVSPISGIVARVMRRPGEYVSPGDAAIVRVIAKDQLIAVFNLPSSDSLHLRVNQVVPLRPRTIPRVVEGTVESIAPAIDGESGTVAIRLRIDNHDEVLMPGDRCVMSNVHKLAKAGDEKPALQKQGVKQR